MTRDPKAFMQNFARAKDGVAAIEFALIAPLLLIMFALSVELGRVYQAHRMFENAITGLGRAIAGSPEYDARLRRAAPLIAAALLPPDSQSRFDLQVTSFVKEQGAMQQLYTHTLFGADPVLPLSSSAASSHFQQNESVIHLAAAYNVVPIFPFLPGFRMTKTYTVMPYFSRRHVWNAGNAPNIYVN